MSDAASWEEDPVWWEMLQGVEAEHPGLVSGARSLLNALECAPEVFGASLVDYTYTDRLAELAGHLDAVGLLVVADRYASGFTVLRTALEHALTDALLLNATKRRDRYVKASEEWETAQRGAWESAQPGTEDIVGIERRGSDVLVVRGTYRLVTGDGRVVGRVSPYHVAMEHHSPFVGKKSDQADRWRQVSTLEERRAHAEENLAWWESYLSWSAIKTHLELNNIYTQRDVRRLDVHYGFLSAFTHAHNDGYRIAHSASPPAGGCHFCRELTILYLATVAAIEVRAAVQHCTDRNEEFVNPCSDALAAVDVASAHLWFPPGRPTAWDRHREVLQRQFESRQMERRVVEPDQLGADEITYYGEPMSRLVALHTSFSEMTTGLTYTTPWPQPGRWQVVHP